MSWTPDRKETLRLMWVEGKTSRQIAEALGDVTRNAVMGMVNRMGLMGNRDHNALIRSVHGACRPISHGGTHEDLPPVTQAAEEPRHDPVPPPPEPTSAPPSAEMADMPEQSGKPRQKLTSRLLGPLRRAIAPERAPVPAAAYVAPGSATARSGRERRPDWRTAVSLVEEILGTPYSPGAKGHRTSLVAIAAILGGGNPQSILPWDFPKPFTLKTMRSLAEKGIMTGGVTPEAWLDPDLGDLNFFIDMLVAEGVMTGDRNSSTPINMTA